LFSPVVSAAEEATGVTRDLPRDKNQESTGHRKRLIQA